jgi:hypothetical protein
MTSLTGWNLTVIAGVVVLGAAIAIGYLAVRRARRASDDRSMSVVSVTLSLAAFWAVIAVTGAAIVVPVTLLSPDVTLAVPVAPYWPLLPEGTVIDGPTATRVSGGLTSGELTVSGLSMAARLCWAMSQGLGWLLSAAIAALIAIACFQLLAGRPFAPVLARATMIMAVSVAVGGVAVAVLGEIAGNLAANELLSVTAAEWTDIPGVESVVDAWWPQPAGFTLTFPFWPIGAGLALAALAAVFRHGGVLQRETEGLV